MSEVQRYICEGDDHSAEMVPCAFGGWVSYEDYTESLAAARRERDGWERRTKEISSVLLRAWEVLRKWWQCSKLEERDEPFAIALARAIEEDASHDAYVLSEMRRLHVVIETVTRERDEAKDFLASYRGTFTREKERADKAEADLATARAALEDWQRKAGEMEMRAILAEREANERGAALEDMRSAIKQAKGALCDLSTTIDTPSQLGWRIRDAATILCRALAQEADHATH